MSAETRKWKIERVFDLPAEPEAGVMYYLLSKTQDLEERSRKLRERTQREIGIYTEEEQAELERSVFLFCGAGGMGASMVLKAVRKGVGTVIVSDPDTISYSNINRQVQTFSDNIGEMKIWALGSMIRRISEDSNVMLVPTGITAEIMDMIIEETGIPDIAFDEIELFAKEARISSHIMLRERNISMITCDAIEFGSFLLFFTNRGKSLVEMLGYTAEAMNTLLEQLRNGTASPEDDAELQRRLFIILIPYVKECSLRPDEFSTVKNWDEGIRTEEVLVTGTTPEAAAAIALLHGTQYVLKQKLGGKFNREILEHPEQPGYVYRDFLLLDKCELVSTAWFSFPIIEKIG